MRQISVKWGKIAGTGAAITGVILMCWGAVEFIKSKVDDKKTESEQSDFNGTSYNLAAINIDDTTTEILENKDTLRVDQVDTNSITYRYNFAAKVLITSRLDEEYKLRLMDTVTFAQVADPDSIKNFQKEGCDIVPSAKAQFAKINMKRFTDEHQKALQRTMRFIEEFGQLHCGLK